ncbi:RluA family pseudouridine synthase [Helicobacter sp. T3_23-1056]
MQICLINELESNQNNTHPQHTPPNKKQSQNLTPIFLQTAQKIRLDEYLAKTLQTSKSQITNLIKKGLVRLNENPIKKGGIYLKENDKIHIKNPNNLTKKDALAQDVSQKDTLSKKDSAYFGVFGGFDEFGEFVEFGGDLEIDRIYENDNFLILNKPPFLCVHSAPSLKEPTLVDWLKKQNIMLSNIASIAGEERAGIVHRLDKQTSGAIIIAKNNQTHAILSQNLKSKNIGRYYLAIINAPLKEKITIESKIARHPKNRLKMANIDSFHNASKNLLESARYAKSEFAPLLCDEKSGISLIAAKLHTGRTHQIRVHLEKINRHILNDTTYGFSTQKILQFEALPRACKNMLLGKIKECEIKAGELNNKESKSNNDFANFIPRVFLHAYLLYMPLELLQMCDYAKSSTLKSSIKNADFFAKSSTQKSQVFCASVFDDMLQFCVKIFGERQFDEAIRIPRILRAFDESYDGHFDEKSSQNLHSNFL